ncbi:MAG: POTRA domain-containing protein [Bacteroidales bacterium]
MYNTVHASEKDSLRRIDEIRVSGNEKTETAIILRELPVDEGDYITLRESEQIKKRIEENLMNTGLFNFIEVSYTVRSGTVNYEINVEERWYIWPKVSIDYADRNINSWWRKKDPGRINYTIGLSHQNFRGKGEEIGAKLQLGHEQAFSLNYSIPYLNRAKTLGFMLNTTYKALHTLQYGSIDHQSLYATLEDKYLSESLQFTASLKYRPHIKTQHRFTLGWYNYRLNDTLKALNKNYASQTEYGFVYLSYTGKFDYRDYKAYPLQGYYLDFQAKKYGWNTQSIDHLILKSTFRKYFPLYNNNWYFAASITGQCKAGGQIPYFLIKNKGMGYNRDYVRGMEHYVFDRPNWTYVKTNIKRKILSQKIIQVGFLKNEFLGEKFSKIPIRIFANLFYDAGYVFGQPQEEEINPLLNEWHQGFGLGLDLISYYDKVLRTEISLNQRGETGVYFHMIAPI